MVKKRGKAHHPIQPLITAPDGVIRFKENLIVDFLLKTSRYDLNRLAVMDFSNEDWEQFAQLIGYSLSGWSTLNYVSDKSYKLAENQEVYGKQ